MAALLEPILFVSTKRGLLDWILSYMYVVDKLDCSLRHSADDRMLSKVAPSSSQSLPFILSLRLYSSFITSRPGFA